KGKKKIKEEDESDTESEGIPEAEKKFKQLARDEEMARKTALSNEYDFIQARMEADRLLALRHQDEEREKFTVEERAKFLHDTIAAQEEVKDTDQRKLRKKTSKGTAKVEVKSRVKERKGGSYQNDLQEKAKENSQMLEQYDEHRKCLKIVTFEGTIDSEIMEKKSFIARLNKVSSPDGDYLVIYRANGNFRGQSISHEEITLEGIELILLGDLKIMMESSTEGNDQSDFWDDQQDWKIVIWRLYEACGDILEFEDGTVIHMLVERRYPLSKDLLTKMLGCGLEA
ncbi:hypothetical protein Tco_1073309, partial [Tanacetum coccineum]